MLDGAGVAKVEIVDQEGKRGVVWDGEEDGGVAWGTRHARMSHRRERKERAGAGRGGVEMGDGRVGEEVAEEGGLGGEIVLV